MSRPFTLTRAEARELKRRSTRLRREGNGVSHATVRRRWLEEMESELRAMVREYDGSPRKARELLEALLIAEEEGVATVAEIRHHLAGKMARKKAA